MEKQLFYKHSVDKYRISYEDDFNTIQSVEMWGTELGIEEWITKQELRNSSYEIIEKGIVQKGEPVPQERLWF